MKKTATVLFLLLTAACAAGGGDSKKYDRSTSARRPGGAEAPPAYGLIMSDPATYVAYEKTVLSDTFSEPVLLSHWVPDLNLRLAGDYLRQVKSTNNGTPWVDVFDVWQLDQVADALRGFVTEHKNEVTDDSVYWLLRVEQRGGGEAIIELFLTADEENVLRGQVLMQDADAESRWNIALTWVQ